MSHGIRNKFFIHTARAERKVRLCGKLFDFFSYVNTHPLGPKSVAFCPKFSRDSYVEFQEKTISGEFFRNFIDNKGYPLSKLVKFRPTFCNFILGPYCVEKIRTSTFICCFHPGKDARPQTNHKKKMRRRKARTFCFRKTSFFFTLGLGFTTPYSLDSSVSNFYQTFVTISIEFWLRFKPQIRLVGFAIYFLNRVFANF